MKDCSWKWVGALWRAGLTACALTASAIGCGGNDTHDGPGRTIEDAGQRADGTSANAGGQSNAEGGSGGRGAMIGGSGGTAYGGSGGTIVTSVGGAGGSTVVGGSGGVAPLVVSVSAANTVVVGEPLAIAVLTSPDVPAAEVMIEVGDGAKATWQSTSDLTLIFDAPGLYSVRAHARSQGERVVSSAIDVNVLPGELGLRVDESTVAAGVVEVLTFQLDAGAVNVSNVTLHDVTQGANYPMFDDGAPEHGDAIAGDGVHSCLVNESYAKGRVDFQAVFDVSGQPAKSAFVNVVAVDLPTTIDVLETLMDLEAVQSWLASIPFPMGAADFFAGMPDIIPGTTQITSLARSDDYVVMRFASGHTHRLELILEETMGAADPMVCGGVMDACRIEASAATVPLIPANTGGGPAYLQNNRSLIYSWGYVAQANWLGAGHNIRDLLQQDARFMGKVDWVADGAVTVSSLVQPAIYRWSEYGVIVFDGHGNPSAFGTGEQPSEATEQNYWRAIANGDVYSTSRLSRASGSDLIKSVDPTVRYGVRTRWLGQKNPVSPRGTLFFAASCGGGRAMQVLARAHLDSTALLGADGNIQVFSGAIYGKHVFERLLAGTEVQNACDDFAGSCLPGTPSDWNGYWGTVPVVPPLLSGNGRLKLVKPETCNGVDDDGDGQVDNDGACAAGETGAGQETIPASNLSTVTHHAFQISQGIAPGQSLVYELRRDFPAPPSNLQILAVAGSFDDVGYVGNTLVTDDNGACGPVGQVPVGGVDVTDQAIIADGTVTLYLRAREDCCCSTGGEVTLSWSF